jgi:hypothetical protein
MELFPATDQQQLEYIKKVIDRSDYYVVIVAGRYGSIANDNVSYTEKEFEYARSKGVPILAFLHGAPDKIEVGKTDKDTDQAKRLDEFRAKLRSGRIVEFWSDANDLCTKVVIAISNTINLAPAVGWVRGDQAIDPKVLQEAQRLRIENAELQRRIVALEGDEIIFDDKLLGPDDPIELSITAEIHKKNGSRSTIDATVVSNLGDIFLAVYDGVLTETNEHELGSMIGSALASKIEDDAVDKEINNRTENIVIYFRLDSDVVAQLRRQLEALNLIQAIGRTTETTPFIAGMPPVKYREIAWRPTDKGRRYAISKRAFPKRIDPDS